MIYHDIVWWYLFLIPVLWLLQNYIHEWSHVLVIQWYGWDKKIYPFLHWYELDKGITKYGFLKPKEEGRWKFYFARVDYIHTSESKDLNSEMWSHVDIAPRVANSSFMLLTYILYLIWGNAHLQTVLMMFYFFNGVDAVAGWLPIFCWWEDRTLTDIWRFYQNVGWSKLKTCIVAITWVVIALTLFFVPIKTFFI